MRGAGSVAMLDRRNARDSAKRTKGGVLACSIRIEDLRPVFGKTAEQASKELGVGMTVLKRRCRELGVERWPSRQIKCVEKLMDFVKTEGSMDKSEIGFKLQQLERCKESILDGRPKPLPNWAKRSQQQRSKMNYRAKRNGKGNYDLVSEEMMAQSSKKRTHKVVSTRHRKKRSNRCASVSGENEEVESLESKAEVKAETGRRHCGNQSPKSDGQFESRSETVIGESCTTDLGALLPIEATIAKFLAKRQKDKMTDATLCDGAFMQGTSYCAMQHVQDPMSYPPPLERQSLPLTQFYIPHSIPTPTQKESIDVTGAFITETQHITQPSSESFEDKKRSAVREIGEFAQRLGFGINNLNELKLRPLNPGS